MGSVPAAEQPRASFLRRPPPSLSRSGGERGPTLRRDLCPAQRRRAGGSLRGPGPALRPLSKGPSRLPLSSRLPGRRGEVTHPPARRGKERIAQGAPKPRAGESEWAPRRGIVCVCVCECGCARVQRRVCLESALGGPVPRGRSAGGRGLGPVPGQSPVEPERDGGSRRDDTPGGWAGALKGGRGALGPAADPAPKYRPRRRGPLLLTSADLLAGKKLGGREPARHGARPPGVCRRRARSPPPRGCPASAVSGARPARSRRGAHHERR